MSQQTRTPRQRQGDGLVPLTVRVSPGLRERIRFVAESLKKSEASLMRKALIDAFKSLL